MENLALLRLLLNNALFPTPNKHRIFQVQKTLKINTGMERRESPFSLENSFFFFFKDHEFTDNRSTSHNTFTFLFKSLRDVV